MRIQNITSQRAIWLSLLLLSGVQVHAQSAKQNCIESTTESQMEQHYVDDKGQQATRLVPLIKALPGSEVIYTITAKNGCNKSTDKGLVINDAVPEHMTYVMNSALGVGTEITYSVDGKTFVKSDALIIKNIDGSTRTVRAEDIKSIRWTFENAFTPGQTGFVRFRATLN